MTTIILIIHLMLAVALVATILLQRSEGGALGIGGGGDGFMTGRGTANVLTRTTAILAVLFITTSLVLGILATRGGSGDSVLDRVVPPAGQGESTLPDVPAPLGGFEEPSVPPAADVEPVVPAPAEPAEPTVPRAE
ncbi:MAG: preprotein translocase subunit SecG [Parvibaculum sp.]|nr:preprotein translocase subunit SecG [Parvibaculaceae bacterium]MBX3503922.1 preprotein translocase subunit SecG [Parvibaculum sp.]